MAVKTDPTESLRRVPIFGGLDKKELFPKVKSKVLSKEQLDDLGQRMEAMKIERLAASKRR